MSKKNLNVARFFYKGNSHTHPVRRTVLVTDRTATHIKGVEIREGNVVRTPNDAPFKKYSLSQIAKIGQIDKRRILRKNTPESRYSNTTLVQEYLNV